MIDLKKKNREIYFSKNKISFITNNHINFLKKKVKFTKNKRIRICTHKNIGDKLHEMIILLSKETYIRPHKHIGKVESLHVVEGNADVIFFNKKGKVKKKIPLNKNRNFYYRLSTSCFHTFKIKSKYFVFHETTEGPFLKNKTIYAKWSPHEKNLEDARNYLKSL